MIALAWLSAPAGLADPLHKAGNEGAYRHEDSGWLFPKQLGDFTRVGAPYTIDGNNDVGAQYEQARNGPRADAVVDVYASDSAAADAKMENAKAGAARKAGAAARLESEQAFHLDGRAALRAVKVSYASVAESPPSRTSLYFIETERWIVKVLASTQAAGEEADKRLDAFVHELPWDTLGTPGDLH